MKIEKWLRKQRGRAPLAVALGVLLAGAALGVGLVLVVLRDPHPRNAEPGA